MARGKKKPSENKVNSIVEIAIFATANPRIIRALRSVIRQQLNDPKIENVTADSVLDALSNNRTEQFNKLLEGL